MEKSIDYSIMPDFENCQPRITLLVTAKTRREHKSNLNKWLALKADKIEKDLLKNDCEERIAPLMTKLRNLIAGDFSKKEGKSLGIFVSPYSQKVYYFTTTDPSELKFPPVCVKTY